MPFWLLDGKVVVDSGGFPIDCPTCPCDGGDCAPCCMCIRFLVTLDNGSDPAEEVELIIEGANTQDDCCCEYASGVVAIPVGGGTIALSGIMVRNYFYWKVDVIGSTDYGTFSSAWKSTGTTYDDCCPDVTASCVNTGAEFVICNDSDDPITVTLEAEACPVDCQINCDGCSDTYTLTATLDGWCSFIDISGETMTRLLAPLDCEWESAGINPWHLYCRDGRWYIDNIPSLVVECDIGTGSCPPTGSGSCLFPVGADCAGQTLSWTLSSP